MTLLEQGVPILDTVHQMGYADQPHLTRSMRRLAGRSWSSLTRHILRQPTPVTKARSDQQAPSSAV